MALIRILSNKLCMVDCSGESEKFPLSVIEFRCEDNIAEKIKTGFFSKLEFEVSGLKIQTFEQETQGVLNTDYKINVVKALSTNNVTIEN